MKCSDKQSNESCPNLRHTDVRGSVQDDMIRLCIIVIFLHFACKTRHPNDLGEVDQIRTDLDHIRSYCAVLSLATAVCTECMYEYSDHKRRNERPKRKEKTLKCP